MKDISLKFTFFRKKKKNTFFSWDYRPNAALGYTCLTLLILYMLSGCYCGNLAINLFCLIWSRQRSQTLFTQNISHSFNRINGHLDLCTKHKQPDMNHLPKFKSVFQFLYGTHSVHISGSTANWPYFYNITHWSKPTTQNPSLPHCCWKSNDSLPTGFF